MDAACYNSSDGFIYAVRGGRVFKVNATTGSIVSFADYNKRILSTSSIAYASGNNTLWAGGWNDQTSNQTIGNAIPSVSYFGKRTMQKIDPATLNVLQNVSLDAAFPHGSSPDIWDAAQQVQAGIWDLRSVGTSIYASIVEVDGGFQNANTYQVLFDPTNIASFTVNEQAINQGQAAFTSLTRLRM